MLEGYTDDLVCIGNNVLIDGITTLCNVTTNKVATGVLSAVDLYSRCLQIRLFLF